MFSLFYRVEIIGLENIPSEGGAILCANHRSQLDMLFLCYRLKRWVFWMAKDELFKIPVLGKFFLALGAFPVKRGKGDVGSIKASYKLLEEGKILGIFPQGTRVKNHTKGEVKIKSGAAMIAIGSRVPIIPAAIVGGYLPFTKINIIYGKPFYPSVEEGKKHTKEDLRKISQEIMEKIYSLMEGF